VLSLPPRRPTLYGDPPDLIPLSVLELDLLPPATGWSAYLAGRGIAVEVDDIGRLAVGRAVARELLQEQAEQRAVADRKRVEAEQRAIEQDRQRRAQLPAGIPADRVADGLTPAMAMMAADLDAARPRRVTPLQEALSQGTLTYHPIEEDAGWVVGGGDGS
jgi:hypothetical protein